MSFGTSISHVFNNAFNYQGRASRSEYWWWYLFVVIVTFAAYILDWITGLANHGNVLTIIVGIIVLVLDLSVGCRRLHDSNKSGWLQLLYILPCVGGLVLLILFLLPSTPGANTYGESAPTA